MGPASWAVGLSVRRTKLVRSDSGMVSVVTSPVSLSMAWMRSRHPAAGAAGRGRAPTSPASSWTRPPLLLTLITEPSPGATASARWAAASARSALALAAWAWAAAASTCSPAADTEASACPAASPAFWALWAAAWEKFWASTALAMTWATNCSYREEEGGSASPSVGRVSQVS